MEGQKIDVRGIERKRNLKKKEKQEEMEQTEGFEVRNRNRRRLVVSFWEFLEIQTAYNSFSTFFFFFFNCL